MKYDLADVCSYLKTLIIPHTSDDFVCAAPFRYGFDDDELLKGIAAFREFLHCLFDRLAAGKNDIDVETGKDYDPRRESGYGDRFRVKDCFPSIFDLSIILCSLGVRGTIERRPEIKLTVKSTDLLTAICPITEQSVSLIKMSAKRKSEMFNLLFDLGLRFQPQLSNDVDFAQTETFYVTSEFNKYLPLGLKLISEATARYDYHYHYKLENMVYPIFLRGSVYPLAHNASKKYIVKIEDFANSRPQEIKEWIMNLDAFLIQNGCTFSHNQGGNDIQFTYYKRKKENRRGMVCQLYMNISGSYIMPGVRYLENEHDISNILPDDMVNLIIAKAKRECGWCKRSRRNPPHIQCIPGCPYSFIYKGEEYIKCRYAEFEIPLDSAQNRDIVWKWIEAELALG